MLSTVVLQADGVRGGGADLQQLMAQAVQCAKEQLLGRSCQLAMCWQGEYVKAYLVVQRDEAITGSTSRPGFHPPMSLLFPHAAVDSLKLSAAAVKASRATMRRIEQQHFDGAIPPISHPDVQRGVSQWVAAAIGQQKEKLETTIRHVQFLNSLVQQLGTARQQSEKKKVLRQKHNMQQKAEAQLRELQAAAKWALALKEHRVVAAWEGDLGTELATLVTTTYQQLSHVLRSSVVGGMVEEGQAGAAGGSGDGTAVTQQQQAAAAAGTAATYTAEEAALRVYLLQLRRSHLQEEVQLVQKERAQLLSNLRQRIVVLTAMLDPDGAHCTGAADGPAYLFARELQHTQGLLAIAERLHGASADGEAAAWAAAEAMLLLDGGIDEGRGDEQL
jgi:hypothetical protein